MADPRAVVRVDRELAALCARALPWGALWTAARRSIGAAIPFDASSFAVTDPTTLLPTAGLLEALPGTYCASILDNELRVEDYDKYAALARAPRHVGILGVSTGGRPERSARFRDVLSPLGLERQARGACVASGGCWAWIDLYRERGSPEFTPLEARVLERAAARLADAVRVSLLFEHGPARAPGDEAGVVLLGAGLEIVAQDPVAERWLEEMRATNPDAAAGPVPLGLQAVAAGARLRRASPGASPPARVRVRTRSGRWLVLHGFTPAGRAGVEIAAVIEPVAPLELAELQIRAFGLTGTERRVLQGVLQGLCTKEIAAALGVSPYTVRDHLTHVFDKTGARSRGQLFALFAAMRPGHHPAPAAPGALLGDAALERGGRAP